MRQEVKVLYIFIHFQSIFNSIVFIFILILTDSCQGDSGGPLQGKYIKDIKPHLTLINQHQKRSF